MVTIVGVLPQVKRGTEQTRTLQGEREAEQTRTLQGERNKQFPFALQPSPLLRRHLTVAALRG